MWELQWEDVAGSFGRMENSYLLSCATGLYQKGVLGGF